MPDKISAFVDSFWQWIVMVFAAGGGVGAAKVKLVTKNELETKCAEMKESMTGCDHGQEKRLDKIIPDLVFQPQCNARFDALMGAIKDQKEMSKEIRDDIKNILKGMNK